MDALERRLHGCMSAGCALVALGFLLWIVFAVAAEMLHVSVTPGLLAVGVGACILIGLSSTGGKRKATGQDAGLAGGGGTGAPLLPPARRRPISTWRELQELAACRGLLTEEEFARARAELLGLPEEPAGPKRRQRR